MKYCILNGKVILKDEVIEANVYVRDDRICEISSRKPQDETIIDAKGRYVAPGFIDVHSHGRGGSDTMYPTFDDINTISKTSLKLSGNSKRSFTICPGDMAYTKSTTSSIVC